MVDYIDFLKVIRTRDVAEQFQAVANIRKSAATTGNPRALGQLGYCTAVGLGVVRADPPQGLALLEQAAEQLDIFSLYVVGSWRIIGRPHLAQDVKRGMADLYKIKEIQTDEAQTFYQGCLTEFDRVFRALDAPTEQEEWLLL